MRVSLIVAGVLLLRLSAANARHPPPNPLRFACDSFPASLTAATLARRYGAANVVSESINEGEGEFARGTVLFPTDSSRRVEIAWRDTIARQRPEFVRVWTARTQWETPEHITIGTRLRTLEHLNGRPFRLAGFAFDGSGSVISWSGGTLGRTTPDGCSFYAGLEPDPRDAAEARWERQVTGDAAFSSAYPAMQHLDPRVQRMELRYSRK